MIRDHDLLEPSPSTGWRETYRIMGVPTPGVNQ